MALSCSGCPLSLKTPNMGNPGLYKRERELGQNRAWPFPWGGMVGASYTGYDVGMKRTPPIRLSQAAEADLAAIGELLRGDRPIPLTRGDTLRYALLLTRGYLQSRLDQGKAFPAIEQLARKR